jgi:hypothetical protein
MTFVGKTDIVQANLRFSLYDQQIENTLYFQYKTSGVDVAAMQVLGQDLIAWWDTYIPTALVNDLVMREVYLTDLSTQTSPTVTVVPGTTVAGASSADSVPNNVTLCVSFRTAGRGRSARGRNYISGFSEGAVTGNTFDPSIAEDIRAGYEELLDATTYTGDWGWVVYSRFENGVPRDEGQALPVDAVVLTDLVVDSQRRRLPGRGR